jgi:hypothetical protein
MKKPVKYSIIGIIAAVVVIGIATYAINPEMFQGRFWFKRVEKMEVKDYWRFRDKPVTVVTSPVPTVVPSEVVSDEGPSQVLSAILTPVASAVPLPRNIARRVNLRDLPVLDASDLMRKAQEDLDRNPKKYELSKTKKLRLIELYETNIEKLKTDDLKIDNIQIDTVRRDMFR